MKSRSVGYEIIRSYVRFAFWLTHKKVVVTGLEFIPKDKPVIFAPNHQNALMDPLALACTNKYQTVWLARADIFKSKTAQSILKYLKLLPVYRIRDGKENLSNNESIFSQVIGLLENKQTVALFPEAAHSGKRKMLPHKKAIPRIALEAESRNDFSLNLQIVPVGIWYSHYWDFNRTVIVEYGNPIHVSEYQSEWDENPQKAMMSLREEIYNRLAPLTIHIISEQYYPEYEKISQIAAETYSKNHHFSNVPELQMFNAEKALITQMEQLEKNNPERFAKLINEYANYSQELKKYGLTDEQVKKAGNTNFFLYLIRILIAVISIPVFIFGVAFNALPYFLIRRTIRPRVKDTAFLSTFYFVTGLIVFPLFYFLEAAVLFSFSGLGIVSWITLLLMPFGGKVAYQLVPFYRELVQQFILYTGQKSRRKNILQIQKQRSALAGLVSAKSYI